MLRQLRRVLVRGTRWFLANGGKPVRLVEAVGRFRPGIGRIVAALETVLGEEAADVLRRTIEDNVAQGVEPELARSLAALPYLLPSGDIVLVARRAAGDQAPEESALLATARVYFALDTVLGIGWIRERLGRVALRSGWDRLALAGQEEGFPSSSVGWPWPLSRPGFPAARSVRRRPASIGIWPAVCTGSIAIAGSRRSWRPSRRSTSPP